MKTRVRVIKGMLQGQYGYIDGHVSGTNSFAIVVVLDSGSIRYFDMSELIALVE